MRAKIAQKREKIKRLLLLNLLIWTLFIMSALGSSMFIDFSKKCFGEFYQVQFSTIQKAVGRITGIGGTPKFDAKDKIEKDEIKESEDAAVISPKPQKQSTTLAYSRQVLPGVAKGPRKRTRITRPRISGDKDRDDIVSMPRGGGDAFADPYSEVEYDDPDYMDIEGPEIPFGSEGEIIIEEEGPVQESSPEETPAAEDDSSSDDSEDDSPSSPPTRYYVGSVTEPREIEPISEVDFTAEVIAGEAPFAPFTVKFTDQSIGTIDNWKWNFGDGGTSKEQSPTYTYNTPAPSRYTVTLIVSGPGGTVSLAKAGYIYVRYPPPEAAFTFDPSEGRAPLTVTFTDQSTQYGGDIFFWHWLFEDGATSTEQNPSHTYDTPGTYTVSLTVTGNGGTGDPVTKTITAFYPPVADFTADVTKGEAPLTVTFTDKSTGIVNTWKWTFGDGEESTEQNPSHTYDAPGIYAVSLTVTGPGGSDTETKTDYITVTTPPPVADFTASPTLGLAPLTVNFIDTSMGEITDWLWDFGDGDWSPDQNPTHPYDYPGVYTVSLAVYNHYGEDTEEKLDYITVADTVVSNVVTLYQTLDDALPGDIILMEPGEYILTSDLNITKNIRLAGSGPDATFINCGSYKIVVADPYWYYHAWGPYTYPTGYGYTTYYITPEYDFEEGFATVNDVTLQGLTVRGFNGKRGPIRNYSQTLKIKNCRITNNIGRSCSGIFSYISTKVIIEDTLIAENENRGDPAYGALLCYKRKLRGSGRRFYQHSVFAGVIYLHQAHLELINSTIVNNINNLTWGRKGISTDEYFSYFYYKYSAIVMSHFNSGIIGAWNDDLGKYEPGMINSIMWNNGNGGQDIWRGPYYDVSDIDYVTIDNSDVQFNLSLLEGYSYAETVIQEDPVFIDYVPQNENCDGMGPSWLQPE